MAWLQNDIVWIIGVGVIYIILVSPIVMFAKYRLVAWALWLIAFYPIVEASGFAFKPELSQGDYLGKRLFGYLIAPPIISLMMCLAKPHWQQWLPKLWMQWLFVSLLIVSPLFIFYSNI